MEREIFNFPRCKTNIYVKTGGILSTKGASKLNFQNVIIKNMRMDNLIFANSEALIKKANCPFSVEPKKNAENKGYLPIKDGKI